MNDINAAQRLRLAAYEQSEAEKIRIVKAAEADAEAKFLAGQGIARQRQAIISGLRESVQTFQSEVSDVNSRDVMELLLITQYFDTLKARGRWGPRGRGGKGGGEEETVAWATSSVGWVFRSGAGGWPGRERSGPSTPPTRPQFPPLPLTTPPSRSPTSTPIRAGHRHHLPLKHGVPPTRPWSGGRRGVRHSQRLADGPGRRSWSCARGVVHDALRPPPPSTPSTPPSPCNACMTTVIGWERGRADAGPHSPVTPPALPVGALQDCPALSPARLATKTSTRTTPPMPEGRGPVVRVACAHATPSLFCFTALDHACMHAGQPAAGEAFLRSPGALVHRLSIRRLRRPCPCPAAVAPPEPGTSLPPARGWWSPRDPCRPAPAPGGGTCGARH